MKSYKQLKEDLEVNISYTLVGDNGIICTSDVLQVIHEKLFPEHRFVALTEYGVKSFHPFDFRIGTVSDGESHANIGLMLDAKHNRSINKELNESIGPIKTEFGTDYVNGSILYNENKSVTTNFKFNNFQITVAAFNRNDEWEIAWGFDDGVSDERGNSLAMSPSKGREIQNIIEFYNRLFYVLLQMFKVCPAKIIYFKPIDLGNTEHTKRLTKLYDSFSHSSSFVSMMRKYGWKQFINGTNKYIRVNN